MEIPWDLLRVIVWFRGSGFRLCIYIYTYTRRVTCFDLFGRFVCVDGKIGLLDFFAKSRGQQGR